MSCSLVAALEANSTHLVAKAVVAYAGDRGDKRLSADAVEEIAGQGVCGVVDMRTVLAGNTKLLRRFGVGYPADLDENGENVIAIAVDRRYSGYFVVADRIRPDAAQALREIKELGVRQIVILSGDKDTIVQRMAQAVSNSAAYGGLSPEDKAGRVKALMAGGGKLAFVGDAVNDALLLSQADVGIAMGGFGFATKNEAAHVVIQTDQLCMIATARRISAATHRVVWQNIWLAFLEKAVMLGFGAWGVVTMWEAALADLGVVLLATLNAARLQRMDFRSTPVAPSGVYVPVIGAGSDRGGVQ